MRPPETYRVTGGAPFGIDGIARKLNVTRSGVNSITVPRNLGHEWHCWHYGRHRARPGGAGGQDPEARLEQSASASIVSARQGTAAWIRACAHVRTGRPPVVRAATGQAATRSDLLRTPRTDPAAHGAHAVFLRPRLACSFCLVGLLWRLGKIGSSSPAGEMSVSVHCLPHSTNQPTVTNPCSGQGGPVLDP